MIFISVTELTLILTLTLTLTLNRPKNNSGELTDKHQFKTYLLTYEAVIEEFGKSNRRLQLLVGMPIKWNTFGSGAS